jgi:glycogen debranching enzyme
MPESAAREVAAEKFHIAADGETMEQNRQVLKCGDAFGVFDEYGNLFARERSAEGLFFEDTRYLADLRLTVAGGSLMLLGSAITGDRKLAVDLTNPDIFKGDSIVVPREWLHVQRTKALGPSGCCETLRFHNYGDQALALPLAFTFGADFADIFEVRGQRRKRRGELHAPQLLGDGVRLSYTGLDKVRRETVLRFSPAPRALTESTARYELALEPGDAFELTVAIECHRPGRRPLGGMHEDRPRAQISSSNALFDEWLARSRSDIDMLTTATPEGPYPYAGIPWFSTAFGRDAIITALECLWLDPGLARGVLRFLGAMQATTVDPENDAEPGKILHEMRKGEMSALKEIPFGRYYGSIDGTLLFVVLAAAYWERTGDLATTRELWPHVEAALGWMETYGDADKDGIIEYDRKSTTGLLNQGWKDSNDSVFTADGALAQPPIALVEVQAYAFAARLGAVKLARALGDTERAKALFHDAVELRDRFEKRFWNEELGTYVLALDGRKQQCLVHSSNAGHALFCGIATDERARRVAETLMSDTGYSGWGIRTVASDAARFNPMSYHNGSIWPHDNALIGMGFARYGFKDHLLRLLCGMFDATSWIPLNRLPELFCGFHRRPGQGPTSYPVACSPQAWSSAVCFGLIGGCLGVEFDAAAQHVCFHRPVLPSFLDELRVDGLRLGDASVDLLFRRHTTDVAVNVLRREGHLDVIVMS